MSDWWLDGWVIIGYSTGCIITTRYQDIKVCLLPKLAARGVIINPLGDGSFCTSVLFDSRRFKTFMFMIDLDFPNAPTSIKSDKV